MVAPYKALYISLFIGERGTFTLHTKSVTISVSVILLLLLLFDPAPAEPWNKVPEGGGRGPIDAVEKCDASRGQIQPIVRAKTTDCMRQNNRLSEPKRIDCFAPREHWLPEVLGLPCDSPTVYTRDAMWRRYMSRLVSLSTWWMWPRRWSWVVKLSAVLSSLIWKEPLPVTGRYSSQ